MKFSVVHLMPSVSCREIVVKMLALLGVMVLSRPVIGQPAPVGPNPGQRAAIVQALEETYPDRPEWVDMMVDILQGSQLGPNDGWFRRAVAQTRFPWSTVRGWWDRDNDQVITRKEFPGPSDDYGRLDRNRDRVLTEADFDFSAHALTPTLGSMVFARMDQDGNGKITKTEYDNLFGQMDEGPSGFLSLRDLQTLFDPPPVAAPVQTQVPGGAKAPAGAAPQGGPTPEMLIRGLFRQEIGSLQSGPALNDQAPDFALKTVDGSRTETLPQGAGGQPVVLIFGNFTCGPFRNQAGNVEKLHQRYKDRARFLMVYVREAHPTDGWRMESNDRVDVRLPQPQTYEERVAVAQQCAQRLKLGFPTLVDSIDDAVGAQYSGMPSRLYLIDPQHRIAYKSGRGPFGFKPAELEHALILLLNASKTTDQP